MKFIFRIEENGYELRAWDEFNEEIGELLTESWDLRSIHSYLKNMNFYIPLSKLKKAEKELEDKSFIILSEVDEKSIFHKDLIINE